MSYYILAIDPGSTSTKAALYCDKQPLFDLMIEHKACDLECYDSITDQFEWRQDLILYHLEQEGFDPSRLSAVIGRGGITKPVEGGVYAINDKLWHDTKYAAMDHACNLGVLIARAIADHVGIPAYTADPVVLDQMQPVARISGHPLIPRTSIFHALNSRAVARIHARNMDKSVEQLNLIIAHLGGGVTVSLHSKGRVLDTYCGMGGDGAFSPERAGRVAANTLIDICYSGEYSQREVHKMIVGEGGFVAHLGTNSMIEVMQMIEAGDQKAQLIVDAFIYNVAKDIGALSTSVSGEVDGIIITGGIAHNKYITNQIESRCKFIAPIYVHAGESELESLAHNALSVLTGEVKAKEYV